MKELLKFIVKPMIIYASAYLIILLIDSYFFEELPIHIILIKSMIYGLLMAIFFLLIQVIKLRKYGVSFKDKIFFDKKPEVQFQSKLSLIEIIEKVKMNTNFKQISDTSEGLEVLYKQGSNWYYNRVSLKTINNQQEDYFIYSISSQISSNRNILDLGSNLKSIFTFKKQIL